MNISHLAIDPASSTGLAWIHEGDAHPTWGNVSGLLSIPSYEPLLEFLNEVKRRGNKLVVTVEYLKGIVGSSQVQYAGNQILLWLHKNVPTKQLDIRKVVPRSWQCKIHKGIEGKSTKDKSKAYVYDWLGERVDSDDAADALCILKYSLLFPSATQKTKKAVKARKKRK